MTAERLAKNFERLRTWTQDNDFLFLFLNFDTVLWNWTPEKFTNIWRIEWDGTSTIKFAGGRGNSLSKWRFLYASLPLLLKLPNAWDNKEMFHNNCLVPFLHMNNFFSCFGFWLLHRLFKFWRNDFLFIYKRNNFIILIEGIWSMKRRE